MDKSDKYLIIGLIGIAVLFPFLLVLFANTKGVFVLVLSFIFAIIGTVFLLKSWSAHFDEYLNQNK